MSAEEDAPVSWLSSWIRHIIAAAVIIPGAVLLIIAALPLLPLRRLRVRLGNLYGYTIGPIVTAIAGIQLECEGLQHTRVDQPTLFVMNHTSNADPWVAMQVVPSPTASIAKKEIFRVPFFGQAYFLAGHLLLDRKDRNKAIRSVDSLAATMKRLRLSMLVWPEGTMPKDGRLLPFRPGFVHMAIAVGCPVVPIVAQGAHIRWEPRSMTLRPGVLKLQVLPPIDTTGWTPERASEHASDIRQRFLEVLSPDQQPLGGDDD